MNPPFIKINRIEIGGTIIVIEFDDSLSEYGHWNPDLQVIKIGPRAEKTFWETLRHEAVHAALDIGGVSYCESMEVEAIVRCMDGLFFPAWDAVQLLIPRP